MSGFEIAGAALAVAGLLLSIRGAVDGYILLTDICEKDNGLRFAATQYYVEKVKLRVWAERFKVDDEANCLLPAQPRITRDAVWRIIAEINATHELAVDFIAKYRAEPAALPTAAAAAAAGPETFHRQSKWVAMVRDARARVPQNHRVSWAARDRAKFTELIARLGVLNSDLWDVVTPDDTDTVRIVTGVLSGLRDQLALATLQSSPTNSPASLLAFATQLKQMQGQSVSDLATKVVTIDATELHVQNGASNDTASRFRGTYTSKSPGSLPAPVWLEWKAISKDNDSLGEIEQRIRALGALLTTPNAAAFHRPTCLGLYDDAAYRERTGGSRRIGFVYQLEGNASALPVTLLDLLREAAKSRSRPPLGERFGLAYKLAEALSLFHAADWVHKSLRSDAVLFESGGGGAIATPLIARFQYSRPAADSSLESRPAEVPELDVYYHPDVVAQGWNKVREIYSLGMILLEIAHWRPVFEARFRTMAPKEVARSVLDDVEGKFGEDLAGLVGRKFVDVIKCCLTGDFGVASGASADESKALSDAFFQKVVKPLASLSA
ncbi:hypothetical protein CONLIGDRAFT_711126 [Coniochaeta ligniaria NRRL 30616]|uniref:Protein kinase domain-containing protein n=1 Tax=Coniochaeta ligniaria NRRL 30616 TaxID=1408157 RepID=A0A1J7J1D2_9PEZI|nr:hypothetical protein CONLIGDRAFT_711126 [Coniochaeta ligniaria NRRL 30616]